MKNLQRTLLANVLGVTLALSGFVPSSQAVDYYWNVGGPGNWDTTTANWTTNPAGGAATTWVNSLSSNDAYFSAGTTTTGAFTVSVTSVVDMDDLIFQEGSVTLAGSGGTFRIANGGGTGGVDILSTSGAVTFDSSLVVDFAGTSPQTWQNQSSSVFTINSGLPFRSSGSRTVTLTPGAGGIRANGVLSGGVSGGATVVIGTGSGAVTYTNNNTYVGSTTVNGTLILSGTGSISQASNAPVTVAVGGTLGGNGTVNSALTVNGMLAPETEGGSDIGTFTVNDDVTWNGSAGQDWKFDLGLTSGSSDLLLLTGAGNDFLKGTGSLFQFDFLNTGTAGTFTLVDWTSSTTFLASDFSYTNLASGFTGSFALNGSQLEFTVVPEPSPVAMVLAGLGMFVAIKRRRRGCSSLRS